MKQSFNVQGMTCGHCEKAVLAAVKQLDPSAEVLIDHNENRVDVQTLLPRDSVAQAIREEGYTVTA